MGTVEIIRLIIGAILILYGLGFNWYEKFKDMHYIDQRNGVLNGKVSILVGVALSAVSVKIGVLTAIFSIVVLLLEEIILKKKLNKKDL